MSQLFLLLSNIYHSVITLITLICVSQTNSRVRSNMIEIAIHTVGNDATLSYLPRVSFDDQQVYVIMMLCGNVY